MIWGIKVGLSFWLPATTPWGVPIPLPHIWPTVAHVAPTFWAAFGW